MILTSEPVPPKCCDTPHAGMTCADGLTQCCLCYKRFALADLYVGADGWTWDYCKVCAERDSGYLDTCLRACDPARATGTSMARGY
jgi:hypothetical protein